MLTKCPRCGGQIMHDQACLQCGADYRPPAPGEVSALDRKDMLYASAIHPHGRTLPKRIFEKD